MAYTAITITELSRYQEGVVLPYTNGDEVNGHSIDLSRSPKLHLMVFNASANAHSFAISFPREDDPGIHATYNEAWAQTVALSAWQYKMIILDIPPDARRDGNVALIFTADANFDEVRFYAFALNPTLQQTVLRR